MIGKEEFKELIQSYYEHDKLLDKLCEIIPGFFESPIVGWGWRMFKKLVKAYFDKEGVDWIDYYLYENPEKRYYQDGKIFLLETTDDLWELIKDYRK